MRVHLEYFYHYNCDRCKGWWTIADKVPAIGKGVYCPDCCKANVVESIKDYLTERE